MDELRDENPGSTNRQDKFSGREFGRTKYALRVKYMDVFHHRRFGRTSVPPSPPYSLGSAECLRRDTLSSQEFSQIRYILRHISTLIPNYFPRNHPEFRGLFRIAILLVRCDLLTGLIRAFSAVLPVRWDANTHEWQRDYCDDE